MDTIENQHKRDWIGVYGPELGPRLAALHDRCGEDAVRKFLNGKLHGIPYGGLYVSGVRRQGDGEQVLSGLLDQLLGGELVRVVSLAAYYANGRRIPPGMQIVDDQLVDVLDPLINPRSGRADDAV